jgi:DNA polymerase I
MLFTYCVVVDMLGITSEEAKSFISTFLSSYPDTNNFIRSTQKSARLSGGVRTLSGRLRRLQASAEDEEEMAAAQARADRQSVNSMIQGTGADIAKIAMIRVHNKLVDRKLFNQAHLLLQIHDELIFEADSSVAFDVLSILIDGTALAAPILTFDRVLKSYFSSLQRWNRLRSYQCH